MSYEPAGCSVLTPGEEYEPFEESLLAAPLKSLC